MPGDTDEEEQTARRVWDLLRGTVEKLAMPGDEQIKDPEIDECFDWDPGYLMVERCEWVSPDLLALLDTVDALLTRLSRDPRFWSDAAIVGDPLWERVRGTCKEAAALMPSAPWNDGDG